jgi:uncharacterized protein (DUF1501 family)
MRHETLLHVNLGRSGHFSRRRFMQLGAASLAGGILGQVSLHADELKKQGRSCILVWLAGGPSQLETWDPKPGTDNGGDTKVIQTAIAGVEFAEYWPELSKRMKDIAVIRTMAGKEAAHERGTYHLHTGRRLGGPERFPAFGSVVAKELGDPDADLPNFVSVGQTLSSAFLGVQYAPFNVDDPGKLPQNVAASAGERQMSRRLALLQEQEREFAAAGAEQLVAEHESLYQRATTMMRSPKLGALKFDDETDATREAYGNSVVGRGCLVARRLVEVGVPFIEVRQGGWDMHDSIYTRMPNTSAQVDQALSALLGDLKTRGMLDKTVVLCMGEFGRTPKLNVRTPAPGRDHWARNFCVMLAGGGIQGGQVIGQTNPEGQEITDRPVQVEDLFQSWCKAMQIDPTIEYYTPLGRPLTLVDGGEPVKELFA